MLLVALLAMNNESPEGATIIAEGTLPVATPAPFAVSLPVARSMVYAETNESPCVATNRAPVPETVVELLVLHALKPSSTTETSNPGRKRNLISILNPCPLRSSRIAEQIAQAD